MPLGLADTGNENIIKNKSHTIINVLHGSPVCWMTEIWRKFIITVKLFHIP